MDSDREELPEDARCVRCGYSIHALSLDRCPECGTPFNRQAILAMLRGEPIRLPFDDTAAAMLAPPTWWVTVAAAVALVVVYLSPSSIEPDLQNFNTEDRRMFTMIVIIVGSSILIFSLLNRRKAIRRYALSTQQRRFTGRNWWVLPVIMFFTILFDVGEVPRTRIPLIVAFNLSRRSLDSVACKVMNSHQRQPDQRAGLYSLTQITPMSDGVDFRLQGPSNFGFAYTTTGNTPRFRQRTLALGGGWYAYDER